MLLSLVYGSPARGHTMSYHPPTNQLLETGNRILHGPSMFAVKAKIYGVSINNPALTN